MKHRLNQTLFFKLFQPTSQYKQRNKESIGELRNCYEQYSGEYISGPDFLKELIELGFIPNKNDEVKLRLKKQERETYFR
jgi:hypothetical protein